MYKIKLNTKQVRQYNFGHVYLNMVKNLWPNLYFYDLYRRLNFQKNITTINSYNISNNFKSFQKLNLEWKSNKLIKPTNIFRANFNGIFNKTSQISTFKVFLKVTMVGVVTNFFIHKSHRYFYIYNSSSGVNFISIFKIFKIWSNITNLIYNLLYYNLNLLYFGNSFFKTEILALNWSMLRAIKSKWKYIRPFLVFKSMKINDYGHFIFNRLHNLGYQISFIFDINYHLKTIFYLKNSNFYTIGLVPLNTDIYTVDFAIIINQSNLVSYLFFLRYFISLTKNIKLLKYDNFKKTWIGY